MLEMPRKELEREGRIPRTELVCSHYLRVTRKVMVLA